jgi:hypothetical protein
MAEYKFLSETDTEDEKVHQYQLEVKADLGDGDVQTHVQDVVFNPETCQEDAQAYADQMEKELKEQKADAAAKAKAEAEAGSEESSEESR